MRFVLLLFTFLISVFPQESRISENIDLLKRNVANTSGKEKLTNYIKLIDYLSRCRPVLGINEKNNVIKLANELKDDNSLITIYQLLGECYSGIHLNETSIEYFEKALNLSKQIKDSSNIASSLIKIGKMKISLGELDIVLKMFEDALEISERNNFVESKIMAINYLGILNYILDNLEDAEKLSFKGLELAKKINFTNGIELASEHITIIRIKQKRYDEALKYNDTAYNLSVQRDFIANIPAVYYNYSVIYNRLKDYDKALDYLYKSEKIRKSYGDYRGSATDYGMMGRIYLSKNDNKNAIFYFNKAYSILTEYKANRPLVSILLGLTTAYEKLGDYKTALKYFKEYKSVNDSVFNENVKRQTAISNARRQLEEKEKEIKYLEEINKDQNKIQTYLIIFSSIILVLFVSTIFLYAKVRKSRQNLSEINQKLISLNNERNKFFSIISHDLKSPFLGMLGLSSLIKDELNNYNDSHLKDLVNKLDTAINNQYKLVDQLLTWTIIQTGKMPYEPTEFALTDLISNVIEDLKSFSFQKNIRIKENLEKDFIVYADRNMISSVLRNLISNAIKYSFPDSDISIIVHQKNDDYVSVQIKDSGVGISEEKVSKIFHSDSKLSTEGTSKETGTGLGLILVKEMVSKNKGEISVTSKENLGSIFEFTIPLAKK